MAHITKNKFATSNENQSWVLEFGVECTEPLVTPQYTDTPTVTPLVDLSIYYKALNDCILLN